MKDKAYWLWLDQVSGLGARRVKKLLDYFKEAKGIWQADKEQLKSVEGIGEQISQKIIASREEFDFKHQLQQLSKFNVKVVTLSDKCYPKLLKEIYDPPPILYYRGDLSEMQSPCIAVVGSRKCTSYGRKAARNLARELAAKGLPVVSGLARGIDSAGHRGALESGLTYAILGSGLDTIYPPEHEQLAAKISRQGAVLTPFPLGEEPRRQNFPARNRIISGLARGVVVVEAAQKSGSLITANYALDQGREVFAVPGDITRRQSKGTNDLLKTGAKLVESVEDIIEELTMVCSEREHQQLNFRSQNKSEAEISLSEEAEQVYSLLSSQPQQFESLLAELEVGPNQLNSILLNLEVQGLVNRLPGRKFKIV